VGQPIQHKAISETGNRRSANIHIKHKQEGTTKQQNNNSNSKTTTTTTTTATTTKNKK